MEKERYRHNLKAIFGSLKDAVITVDAEMRVIEANESTRSICGLNPQEIIGEIFPESPNQCHKLCHDLISKTLKTQNTVMEYRVECGHQDRPGQIVLLSCSPLIDGDSFMGAVLVIFHFSVQIINLLEIRSQILDHVICLAALCPCITDKDNGFVIF